MEYSGYWIPLLLAPWITAKEILDYKADKTEEYFYNKVLGLPYIGGGNKLSKQASKQRQVSAKMRRGKVDMVLLPWAELHRIEHA